MMVVVVGDRRIDGVNSGCGFWVFGSEMVVSGWGWSRVWWFDGGVAWSNRASGEKVEGGVMTAVVD